MRKQTRTVFALVAMLALVGACGHPDGGGIPPHGTAPPAANPGTVRPSGAPSGRTPVVFVHGYLEDAAMWSVAVERFKAAGYTGGDITNFVYDTEQLTATEAAAQLATEVDVLRRHTKQRKVAVVGHSLGNLVAQVCIVQGGCEGKVSHWENLAGAQNGTLLATQCELPACLDMRPDSALIAALNAAEDAAIEDQKIKVQVQWTPNDGIIVPPEASQEAYAENIQIDPALDHFTMFVNDEVLDTTLALLARR